MPYADYQADIASAIGDLGAEAGLTGTLNRRTGADLSTYVPSTDSPGGSFTNTNFTFVNVEWDEANQPNVMTTRNRAIMVDTSSLAGQVIGEQDHVTISGLRWEVQKVVNNALAGIQILYLQES
jgi:hypothetical protein